MRFFLVILLFFLSFCSVAQSEENAKPMVGLVLSGGGAKGLAHIGVLKVIDSLGLKIDYVAGTSMGAIIGSLYASGYSGKALDSIFNKIDFNTIISDDLPRAAKTLYERNNSEKYIAVLPFEKFKLKLPSALSRGQNTYNLMSRLMLPVSDIESFKELPIPFFCVATNVETGKPVILEEGNLAQAVMASGALPSLFQPVVIDDKVLIDGGVVNNYPIRELKKRGADFIIGVDVQDGLMKKSELTSALDVLLQINNFRTINDMKLKSKLTNIYIKPDIKDFSVVSFNEGNHIIEKGEKAALKHVYSLKSVLGKQNIKHNKKGYKVSKDSISIRDIIVKGNEKYSRSFILGKLKLKGHEKVAYTKFIKGVNNVIATNNFNSFYYQLKPTKSDNEYDLYANIKETKTTTFFKLGVHYDDLYKSAALINLTKKRFLFNNDIVSLDIALGDKVRFNLDYLIDKGFYWGFGIRSRYNQFDKSINAELILNDTQIASAGLNKVDVELKDQTNQFYLETLFRKDFALNLGLEHKRLKIQSETILTSNGDEFLFENTDYFSVFGNLKLDTYDDKYFPKKGVSFNGDLHTYLFASNFNKDFKSFSIAKADLGYAFSLNNKVAFNIQASAGLKIGDRSTQTLDFALGGYGNDLINNFIPFLGYDFISLTGNNYAKVHCGLDFELFSKNHLTLEANWANIDDNIFETGEWFSLPSYRGYGVGYAIDSFIGPIQVKYSFSPEQKQNIWFFNIGFWF